jgi:hypothetical protein
VTERNVSRLIRLLAGCVVAPIIVACAQRASSSPVPAFEPGVGAAEEPPLSCVRSDTGEHHLAIAARPGNRPGELVGIIRGTDHELVRNASVIALQPVGPGPSLRARADSSGRFAIANVPPGSYELRVVSIGYFTSRDTITVPREGLSLDLTQRIILFMDEEALCGYLAHIDSEPVLTPLRGQSTSETHELPDGGSVQTTLTVRPHPDGASFDVLFRNVSDVPVNITRLCYPSIVGDPVRRFPGRIGPSCYGTGMRLPPGDTLGFRETVQLRGQPGTYTFRFHAVDPPVLDAVVPLRLSRGDSPRKP